MPSSVTYPQLIQEPFCKTGSRNTIPVASASPLASFDDGFPPATMTPISSGGVPPEGKDFNGILWTITQWQLWANAGGPARFDATLATEIAGYPAGAIVQSTDLSSFWVNTTDGNSSDPNAASDPGAVGWHLQAGLGAGGNAMVLSDTGSGANVYVVSPTGFTSPKLMPKMLVGFIAGHTNTGSSTLKYGGATASAILRSDGVPVQAGDIVAGSHYSAVFSGVSWLMIGLVPSQYATFTTLHIMTPGTDRILGTTYTNGTGKPMWVSVVTISAGGGADLVGYINGNEVNGQVEQGTGNRCSVELMVPPGATYKVQLSVGAGATLSKWTEVY